LCFAVRGLGLRVEGWNVKRVLRISGLGIGVSGFGFGGKGRASGNAREACEARIANAPLKPAVLGLGFRLEGSWLLVSGFWF